LGAGGGTVDFGIVRVGDSVSRQLGHRAQHGGGCRLERHLRASVSGLAGPFAAGSVAGVAAQASGQIGVTLDTAAPASSARTVWSAS
jgi:hypothetical protein